MDEELMQQFHVFRFAEQTILIDDLAEVPTGFLITHNNQLDFPRLNAIRQQTKDEPEIIIDEQIADEIGFQRTGIHQQNRSISLKNQVTLSASLHKVELIKELARKTVNKSAFNIPGSFHVHIAANEGVIKYQAVVEAAADLAKVAEVTPALLYAQYLAGNGQPLAINEVERVAQKENIKPIYMSELIRYRKRYENHVKREVKTKLPSSFGNFSIVGYSNTLDDKEHIAIVKGDVRGTEPVLTRIHSECLTGDIFGSYRCDCGPQLHAALELIEKAGKGVLIYMRQEGRGIGLLNKLKAYKLQDEGYDTHEANVKLGFLPDAREYYIAAEILQDLGVEQVELLTNNPEKMTAMEHCGVQVAQRVPLQPDFRPENAFYMETKLKKFGHLLDL